MGILLTSTLCFSQSSYPSKLVVDGDTLVCITVDQLRKLNTLLMDRLEYKEMNDSLYVQISIYEQLISNLNQEVNMQQSLIRNIQQQTDLKDTLIKGVDRENVYLKDKVKQKDRVIRYGGGLSVIIILLLLI